MEYVWIIIFVMAIICFVAIILKQLYLLARPDFKLQRLEPSDLMYPSAVRFRLATVSESRSYKLDLTFDWRLRILVCPDKVYELTPVVDNHHILYSSLCTSSSRHRFCSQVPRHHARIRRLPASQFHRPDRHPHSSSYTKFNLAYCFSESGAFQVLVHQRHPV
jgi:hypothetical protein